MSGAVLAGTVWLMMVVGSLAGVPPAFAQTPSAGIRLETGIAKEEIDGDRKSGDFGATDTNGEPAVYRVKNGDYTSATLRAK